MNDKIFKDIDRFVEENRVSLFNDISRLIAVNSTAGEALPGAPFGAGPRAALELGLKIAEELGLGAVNCEGKMGYAALGSGDNYLATITHLDTVPVGEGWSNDPFSMNEREGYIIGRGVMDDKGPSVLCLYALKYLKDRNIPLRYPVRALLGVSEETGMSDVDYYLQNYPAPLFCFSPDADFPLINGEKGMLHGRITATSATENIVDIKGGYAPNAVPDKAEAWIKAAGAQSAAGIDVVFESGVCHLTAHGKGGHASAPQGTVNAIAVLINYILDNKLAGEREAEFLRALMLIHSATDGSGVGIAASDAKFGALTVVGGVIGMDNGRIYQTVDSRYPTATDGASIAAQIAEHMGECAVFKVERDTVPFYMEPDNPAVQVCLKAYEAVTGERAHPITIGGGTYARRFPNAISFGPEHAERPQPAWAGPIHGVDEAASKDYFLEALKIYIAALLELEQLDF